VGIFSGPDDQGGRISLHEGKCPVPLHIHLEATHQLHQQLIGSAAKDSRGYQTISRHAMEVLAEQGTKFEGDKTMAFALSALCLDSASINALRTLAESLHGIVETALDWIFASPARLERHFPDHQRIRPWLRKTRGLASWQGISRYDAVILADGSLRIMELNTGCPAGFMHAEDFSTVTQAAMHALSVKGADLGKDLGLNRGQFGTIPGDALINELLEMETQANISRGQIGLVNDENGLQNELELIAQAFRRHGRDVAIMNAADIHQENGQALWRGQPVSLMFNKVRVSTANSPKHHWKPGFETRYAGFLEAIRQDAAVAVNNLAGLTVAEDKGLLEILRLPEFASQLSPEQRRFVEDYVLWTARMSNREIDWHGRTVDLIPFVQANREHFVIKPANEGRGFGVVVGKYASKEEWQTACELSADLPCVVQEYAEAARLPVVRMQTGECLQVLDHHLTVGLAMIRGKSWGVLSRISTNPVTNVGREGVVQAVFLTDATDGSKS
jgi:hypothetical protein